MDAIKRSSFASKQIPAGPAPLASFEDLPSDELESPEDSDVFKQADPSTETEYASSCNTVLSTNTPDTLPTSNLSTPQVDSDLDSHCTLTPVDSNKTHSESELRTGSLSCLSKEEDVMLAKHKKGSVISLGTYDVSETEYGQRKSSWTDIFRTHNPASKQSSDMPGAENKTKPAQKKKHKSESSKRDSSESKERGKFLGIFKPGKKINRNIDVTQEDCVKIACENKNILQSLEDINGQVIESELNEGKENEQPKQIKLLPVQLQNDLDKSSPVCSEAQKLPAGSKENDMRNNLNIAEKEYNIFFSQSEMCKKTINKENLDDSEVQDGHESSESELAFDAKESAVPKKEDDEDFEKENLLAQDSSEIEDDPSIEMPAIPVFVVPHPVSKVSRQQRLEITTVPIDRPRSTTPINVAPLEAFIHSTSPSFDPKVEKIKLTLPGEQFLSRMKSPKRSNTKSWADFCEEGLHSPRMQKKDEFHHSQDALDHQAMGWDDLKTPDKEWVTFETKSDWDDTPDLFRDLPSDNNIFQEEKMTSAIENLTTLSRCSCECHTRGCENSYINANEHSHGSAKVDVFSDNCQCQCHERYVHLWNPDATSSNDLLSEICDTLKSSSFASDFSQSFPSGNF